VGDAGDGNPPPPPRVLFPGHRLRSPRQWTLRSRTRRNRAVRGRHGRHPRGDGRRGIGKGLAVRLPGRRHAVRAFRGLVPRARLRAGAVEQLGSRPVGFRLPMGLDRSGVGGVPAAGRRGMGNEGTHRRAHALDGTQPSDGCSQRGSLGEVFPFRREPGFGRCPRADSPRQRRAGDPADDPGSRVGSPHGRQSRGARRAGAIHGRANPRRDPDRAAVR
jgi:hypothetical protein